MKTVLLIDEDAGARRGLKSFLASEGWTVWEAQTPEQAWDLAQRQRPRVVVVDFLLPEGAAIQLCRRFRDTPAFDGTVLVAVSARDFPADRQNAREAGARHFLVKPYDPVALKRLLENVAQGDTMVEMPPCTNMIPEDAPTRLRFWGVRGSIPSPGPETVRYGGNTSCVEIRAAGQIIILDAGSGIRPLGLALAREFKGRPLELTLMITHTHWDHIQGFPFFVPAYNPRNTVRVLGYEGATRGLQDTLSGQMESPYFPIGLKEMPGNLQFTELRDLQFSIGSIQVRATYVNHPGVCVGYRLFTPEGSITFIPDNENYVRLKSRSAGAQTVSPEAQAFAEQQDQKLVEFIRGSDLLIVDSQYDAEEYERHVGWGHSCVDDSVNLAVRAEVKKLFLFHHDPSHDDRKIDAMVRHARKLAAGSGRALEVAGARERLEVVLRPAARRRALARAG
jgi:phosphoribosyl 1,2-cyclic phosphodiesterase/CheY-like chemotaxis protein